VSAGLFVVPGSGLGDRTTGLTGCISWSVLWFRNVLS